MNNHVSAAEVYRKAEIELKEWENKRQEAVAKTQELELFLSSLRRYLPELAISSPDVQPEIVISGVFSGMSTREAIKIVLQKENRALPSAEIAELLMQGGVKSTSANFKSNVSAILSVMQSKHHEVLKTPLGWILSQPSLVAALNPAKKSRPKIRARYVSHAGVAE